ncbi:MAG: M48 family metallopeptidase [Candidatus Woesebacteria bacterium]|jgi:heat shock protein HtpX
MLNIYEAIASNKRKSTFVIVFFILFVTLSVYILSQAFGVYMGYEPGGLGVAGVALIIAGILSYVSYYYSDKIVLKISSAKPARRDLHFDFFTAAENLSIAANIPKPKLYVIEDSATNAFATGRDPENAVICATTGLLSKLNRTELEGVIAHEISHIRNYDIRLMSLVSVMVGIIALLGDWFLRMSLHGRKRDRKSGQIGTVILVVGFLFALLSPIIANLIKLAISRRREFFADASAISITRQPGGLISALKKISLDKEPLEAANKATAHLFIANPFKGKVKGAVSLFANLFNTHPPIEERISVLKQMA